jgi:ribonuclease BN (tRNA processing enzyme)
MGEELGNKTEDSLFLSKEFFSIGDAFFQEKHDEAFEIIDGLITTHLKNPKVNEYLNIYRESLVALKEKDFKKAYGSEFSETEGFSKLTLKQREIPEFAFWHFIARCEYAKYVKSKQFSFDSSCKFYTAFDNKMQEKIKVIPEGYVLTRCRYFTVLAEALLWLGKYCEAYATIEKACNLIPLNSRCLFVKSMILESMGQSFDSFKIIKSLCEREERSEYFTWKARLKYIHRNDPEKYIEKNSESVCQLFKKAIEYGKSAGDDYLKGEAEYQFGHFLIEEAYSINQVDCKAKRRKTFEKARKRLTSGEKKLTGFKKNECRLARAKCFIEEAKTFITIDSEKAGVLLRKASRLLEKYRSRKPKGPHPTFHKNIVLGSLAKKPSAYLYFDENTVLGSLAGHLNTYICKLENDIREPSAESKQSAPEKPIEDIMGYEPMRELEREVFDCKEKGTFFLREWQRCDAGIPALHILQRWNSFTPIMGLDGSKGGGYFIDLNDKGIAIDPGFDFVKNFKDGKFAFGQLDYIVISHAHNDHASDLESILTLLHNYNEQLKGDMYSSVFSNSIARQVLEYTDMDNYLIEDFNAQLNKQYESSARRKIIDIYLTLSVYKKYASWLKIDKASMYRLHIIDQDGEDIPFENKNNIKLVQIEAKHDDLISDNYCKGFLFKFENAFWLLYTGDTGYSPRIDTKYKEISAAAQKAGIPLLLLAHLGGFKHRERRNYWQDDLTKAYYEKHLGRLGLIQIAQSVQAGLIVVSEWGEEFKGSCKRAKLCELLTDKLKQDFIPADIGLSLRVNKGKVEIYIQKSKEWVEFSWNKISCNETEKEEGLEYKLKEGC